MPFADGFPCDANLVAETMDGATICVGVMRGLDAIAGFGAVTGFGSPVCLGSTTGSGVFDTAVSAAAGELVVLGTGDGSGTAGVGVTTAAATVGFAVSALLTNIFGP